MDNLTANAVVPIASEINFLDIWIGLLILASAILAYIRGLVQEGLSIAGWIGAIFATVYGFPYIKPYTHELITIYIIADIAAGIIIFVTAMVILTLCTRRISKVIKSSDLNAIDRSLGFLFGLARGALIIIVAYIGIRTIYPENKQPDWIKNSRSLGLIKPGAAMLVALIPENLNAITNINQIDTRGSANKEDGKPLFSGKAIKNLMLPRPKNVDTQKTIPGSYGKKERQQMEQLNESIQDN